MAPHKFTLLWVLSAAVIATCQGRRIARTKKVCNMELYDPELSSCCNMPTILPLYTLQSCVSNANQQIQDTDPYCLFDCAFSNKSYMTKNSEIDKETILLKFLALSSDQWRPVVLEAVDVCLGRMSIDGTLPEFTSEQCRVKPAMFALCFRRFIIANCPRAFRPKTDSNSCTHRLELVKKCDPFAVASGAAGSTRVSTRAVPLTAVSSKPPTTEKKPEKIPTTSASTPPTTMKSTTLAMKTEPTEGDKIEIPLPGIDSPTAAAEGKVVADETPPPRPKRARSAKEIGETLQTIERQIRQIDDMHLNSEDVAQDLTAEVSAKLKSVSEDVEVLGETQPAVLPLAPRLQNIRESLGSFSQLSGLNGLGSRLVLEVSSVRSELLRVASNIQQGISDVGKTLQSGAADVAINVAGEAVGVGQSVDAGLKNVGAAFAAGVGSVQSGIVGLGLEGASQLQKVGAEVAAGVTAFKTNFEALRQQSFQRIQASSDAVSSQLADGLKQLHRLRDDSKLGAQGLALNIQKNLQERLAGIQEQFKAIRLPGK